MILIALEYLILASTFTIAKKALSFGPPLFLVTSRLLVAGFLLTVYAGLRGHISWKKVWNDRWHFASAALFHAYLAFVLEFWALQHMSSAKTSIVYAMTPFIAATLSYILYHERLRVLQWLGMCVGLLGLSPLILVQVEPGNFANLFSISLPELVLFGAVLSSCYAWFVVKRLMNKGYSVALINGIAMLSGGFFCIPTALIAEPNGLSLVHSWPSFTGWVSLLILMSHFMSYNLYSWLLRHYSITFMTFCGFMCPLFSTALGAYFLGEKITWHYIVALIGILLGLTLFTRKSRTQKVSNNRA